MDAPFDTCAETVVLSNRAGLRGECILLAAGHLPVAGVEWVVPSNGGSSHARGRGAECRETRFATLAPAGVAKSNYLLSTAREEAKEHKYNNDDDDDPEDSADRKEHSESCKHSRLQVGVSVSSLLVGLRNRKLSRLVVARLLGRT